MEVVEPVLRGAPLRVERKGRTPVRKIGEAGALRRRDPCDVAAPALEIVEAAAVRRRRASFSIVSAGGSGGVMRKPARVHDPGSPEPDTLSSLLSRRAYRLITLPRRALARPIALPSASFSRTGTSLRENM